MVAGLLLLAFASLGAVAPAAAAPRAHGPPGAARDGAVEVECRGGATVCRARVSLAGGASNRTVVIRLSDTDLSLSSVRPNRRSLRGAYSLGKSRRRAGGSQYVVVLNADQAIPRGSFLIFTFRAPKPARLAWEACEGAPGVQCATLRVPLDWSRPRGAKVKLALTRVRATDRRRRIGSVVFNCGGPGCPSAQLLKSAPELFTARLRERFESLASTRPRPARAPR